MRREFWVEAQAGTPTVVLYHPDNSGDTAFCRPRLAKALGIDVHWLARRKKLVVDILDGKVPRGYHIIRVKRFAGGVEALSYGRYEGNTRFVQFKNLLGFKPRHGFIGVRVIREPRRVESTR